MNFKLKSVFSVMLTGFLTPLALLQGAWVQPPVTVNDPAFTVDATGGQPVMLVTPQGNALAIWYQFTPGDSPERGTVNSSFYTRGIGWAPPQQVSSTLLSPFGGPLYVTQGDPDIAMNSSNYAVAIWEGELVDEPFPFPIISAVRDPNTGIWSPVEILSDVNLFQSMNANVGMNEPGTTLAAWRDTIFDGNFHDRTTIRFLPLGGSWSAPISFSPEGNTANTRDNKPYPVVSNNGDAAASWWFQILEDIDIVGVKVATFKALTNTWTETILDSEEFADFGDDPRCAIGPTGNIVAIWQKDNEIKSSYFNGTSWEANIILATNGTAPPAASNNPSIVMDPQGNITAVWSNEDFEVVAVQRPANGTWGTPQVINGPPDFARFHAFMSCEPLSVNPEGDVIAIWKEGNEIPDQTIWAAVKLFGQDWRAPEQVQLAPSPSGFQVQNAGIASCGFAIALWQERTSDSQPFTRVRATVTENLLLPLDARRAICCEKFTTQTRCVNILTWAPDPCVLFFNIFRDGVLIAQVPGNLPPFFFDHNVCDRSGFYEISTINIWGFEGDRVPVVF